MPLTLPYPRSVNHYWRRFGLRAVISREGRTFRQNVCALLGAGGQCKPPTFGRIALGMDAFPPVQRRRDVDNINQTSEDSCDNGHPIICEDPESAAWSVLPFG